MPTSKSSLKSGLLQVFQSPGPTATDCGASWGSAVASYASGVVPSSPAVSAAASALGASLGAAFATSSAVAAMESAFSTFALAVSAGMSPAFVGTPPPAPVGFAAQFGGTAPATHDDAAEAISSLIDTWFRTGTATPSGGGSPVLWT